MQISAVKTKIIGIGDDIFEKFLETKKELEENNILSISSKIVALSQNRVRNISDYGKNEEEAKEELIKEEADRIYEGKYTLTLKNGILIPFAGIDASNAPKGKFILWPENSYEFAKDLHKKLCDHFRTKNLGIIITDSRCQPLRWGVIGVAIAWYGFEGVQDFRGEKDIFGRPLEHTQKAVADELASASILVQGEANECSPFAIIKYAPVSFEVKDDFLRKSHIDPEEDIFKSVLRL